MLCRRGRWDPNSRDDSVIQSSWEESRGQGNATAGSLGCLQCPNTLHFCGLVKEVTAEVVTSPSGWHRVSKATGDNTKYSLQMLLWESSLSAVPLWISFSLSLFCPMQRMFSMLRKLIWMWGKRAVRKGCKDLNSLRLEPTDLIP